MGYSRSIAPDVWPEGDILDRMLAGIGCAVAAVPLRDANIEDALMGAALAGMEGDDYRILGLAVRWLGLHARVVNVDRLTRLAPGLPGRTRAFWAAIAQWQRADRRWTRLVRGASPIGLLRTGNDFQLRRHGPDPRFAGTCLQAPAGVLRERPGDVLAPRDLAARHAAYRQRILMGPVYRSDMWALAEAEPAAPAADLARRTYGSFATAWQVKVDRALVAP